MSTATTAAGPAVRVRGLVKRYGHPVTGHLAVDGLDLDVERGECFALLGPNGAGKTTTVEVLEGHRSRTAGEVEVLGQDPATAGLDWRARTGIVLQSATDAADLSVQEVVRHFAVYHADPRDPDEVVEAVGLTGQRRTRVRALSGGQRRRLDVALGILGRPELLFLDEPTTGFDPEARRQFHDLVRALRADGTTVLLTTHYLDEAAQLADRVGVVARGRLLEVAPPDRLGGRAALGAVVSWTEDGRPREEVTAAPTALVRSLLARPGLLVDGEVPGLQVRRPTLEDAYLALLDSAGAAADGTGASPEHVPAPTPRRSR
ncbi:ABC transporter ATP-binding protein [Kineococcus sp. SYSU DK004]|uniref:ABC transporter ATP-binding protein n=1 Tax=Kineococcus sp. SYSU DK004 TaxID=3383125 RepID=UPI003D7EBBFF